MPYYYKERKIEELIRQLAAQFLQRESNGLSLVTVTAVTLSDKITKATVLLSVFPKDQEKQALDFARRKRTEFREYVKTRSKMRNLPAIDFAIDLGEKNRQRIEEIDRELQK